MTPLVVTLGELLIDMFPAEQGVGLTEVSAFHPKPGGAPANVAVAIERLGKHSAFIGKVGDDAFGHYLIDVLKAEGVETRGIRLDGEARTTMAFIAMPDANHAEFVFYRNPGADHRLQATELDHALSREATAFHFGSLSLNREPARTATLAAVQAAREGDTLVSFDVNYRPALWDEPAEAIRLTREVLPQVDLVKVNEDEAALLGGVEVKPEDTSSMEQAAKSLLAMGPSIVVMTFGPAGSFYLTAEGSGYVPGFSVNTIDAIGCGDAFVAGLLTHLLDGGEWRSRLGVDDMAATLRFANAVGALTSTRRGVIPALPHIQEVKTFLTSNP